MRQELTLSCFPRHVNVFKIELNDEYAKETIMQDLSESWGFSEYFSVLKIHTLYIISLRFAADFRVHTSLQMERLQGSKV